jgi:hypothetical protein
MATMVARKMSHTLGTYDIEEAAHHSNAAFGHSDKTQDFYTTLIR